MYNSFIPSFHYRTPSSKLTAEWFDEANKYYWYNSGNHSLLEGKDISEIKGYATGNFSMAEFRKMYKSQRKADEASATNGGRIDSRDNNTVGVGFVPLPLIPTKINSARAIVQKIPIEVSVTAQDPLAAKKKNEDLTFLKNKPALEADLQDIADQLQIGKVDLGTTKHSATPFSDSPYGLDLNEPDELQVFVDLLYNLGVEAALETVSQQFWELKNGNQIKSLEIKDQLWYGVSSHFAFESGITSLPDLEYAFPGDVIVPHSELPDFNDNSHRYFTKRITALELMNYFGDEICSIEDLDEIMNDPKFGYCKCNKRDYVNRNDFGSCKVEIVFCMIKSIDYVGVSPINKKSKFKSIVTDEGEAAKCKDKIWGQNTYCAWWLRNTKYYYGIHKSGYSYRTKGQESYQNFPLNIYKSQEKSAVELSIGENKKAQIADIKMQHAIIKSLPAGKYIDLKYLRNALSGLLEEGNKYTQQDLINLAMEQNIMIGDTEGFEGKNDGQLKPLQEIAGGVKTEVIGYMQVIADANQKIAQFTGINEQLTGQSANPEGLIGLQKLLINSSINALYYINEAIESQYQKLFVNWGNLIKDAVERGGKSKQAIVNMIGAKKASLIDALDDLPLHTLGIKFSISQREEEKAKFENELARLKLNNVINTVDEYMLSAVVNPKDRMALLAVKYKQWEKKQEKIRQEQMAQQQVLLQQQGVNQQQAVTAKADGDIKKVYAQGDVSANVLKLAAQLGLQAEQLSFLSKKGLQQDRGQSQLDKSLKTLEAKNNLENQQPFGE